MSDSRTIDNSLQTSPLMKCHSTRAATDHICAGVHTLLLRVEHERNELRIKSEADDAYAQRSREVLAFIAKFAQQMCQEDSPDPREWHDDMNYIAVIAERGTISDDQRQGADSPYVATIDPSEAQTSMAASNKTPPSPAIPAGDAHSTVRPGHPDVPVTEHIPK